MTARFVTSAVMALSVVSAAALVPDTASARGCVTGAAAGGVAGHVAGHHAVIGAVAGCAINHHRDAVKDKKAAQATAAQPPRAPQPAPPN